MLVVHFSPFDCDLNSRMKSKINNRKPNNLWKFLLNLRWHSVLLRNFSSWISSDCYSQFASVFILFSSHWLRLRQIKLMTNPCYQLQFFKNYIGFCWCCEVQQVSDQLKITHNCSCLKILNILNFFNIINAINGFHNWNQAKSVNWIANFAKKSVGILYYHFIT